MLACGKYNLVHEFFEKVQSQIKVKPFAFQMHLMNNSVNALWREGKIDEAIEAVKEMERRGIVGSASLYYDLACYLCSARRLQEVLTQHHGTKVTLLMRTIGTTESSLIQRSDKCSQPGHSQLQQFMSNGKKFAVLMLRSQSLKFCFGS
ncbi:hypothetical protein Ancab_015105 [Ancistrocladus abbreviatus]